MFSLTPDGQTIALISVILSILSAMVRRITIDQKKLKASKERMKEHQKKMKEAQKKGDTKELMRCQEEMTKLLMENLKMSFNIKTMLTTFLPFMIIFGWLSSQYSDSGEVANILGFGLTWFWWYFLVSLVASQIVMKIVERS